MFARIALAASLVACTAAPAMAASTEFNPAWSAQDKFLWAQYNYEEFCPIPMSRPVRFKDLPGWMRTGLGWATEGMVINGIRESCGKEINASTAASYAPQ